MVGLLGPRGEDWTTFMADRASIFLRLSYSEGPAGTLGLAPNAVRRFYTSDLASHRGRESLRVEFLADASAWLTLTADDEALLFDDGPPFANLVPALAANALLSLEPTVPDIRQEPGPIVPTYYHGPHGDDLGLLTASKAAHMEATWQINFWVGSGTAEAHRSAGQGVVRRACREVREPTGETQGARDPNACQCLARRRSRCGTRRPS